jgi:hypothetical protein
MAEQAHAHITMAPGAPHDAIPDPAERTKIASGNAETLFRLI